MPDEARNVEDHVVSSGLLPQLSVDVRGDLELRGVADHVGRGYDGTQGAKLVHRLAVAVLTARARLVLPVARRDVVADRVAQHIVEGVV